jgi:hypothetical protein
MTLHCHPHPSPRERCIDQPEARNEARHRHDRLQALLLRGARNRGLSRSLEGESELICHASKKRLVRGGKALRCKSV